MTAQDTQLRQVSQIDLGSELCRYRAKSLGESLPKQVVLHWLMFLLYCLFTALVIAWGAAYMAAPLLLLADAIHGLAPAGSVWRPVIGWSLYAACCGFLAFVIYAWPRLIYLAICEKGFIYHAMRRRYTICFEDVARCFITRDSCGVTIVLRDSTRLRFHHLGGQFGRQCVGELFHRINEHLAVRSEDASQQSLRAGEAVAVLAEHTEMAVPNALWCREIVTGLFILFTFLLAPAFFAAVSLIVFQLDIEGKICTWLVLLFTVSLLWLASRDVRMHYKHQGGLGEFGRDLLSFFAWKHFLESVPQGDGSVEIRYGFRFFGHRNLFFKLPLDKVEGVRWRPGQGGAWTVFLQCDDDRVEYGSASIGPSGSVSKIEDLGLAIVDLLRRAGAKLVEGEDETTYETTSAGPTKGAPA